MHCNPLTHLLALFPLYRQCSFLDPARSLYDGLAEPGTLLMLYRLEEGLVNHQSPFCGSRTFGMCWATSQGLTSIGTTLHIDNHKLQPDGRMLVTTKGERMPGLPCRGWFTLHVCSPLSCEQRLTIFSKRTGLGCCIMRLCSMLTRALPVSR